jgi:flagellar assembly factor FliW
MARLKYKLEENNITEIETKLGVIKVNVSNAICFPQGIVGFGNLHNYCLAEIPDNILPGALMLQNLEDKKLGFITIPISDIFLKGEKPLINYEDILSAAESYGILPENLTVLAILTISKQDGKIGVSINLKAPIIIDKLEKIAYQHVFIKNDYPIAYSLK